MAAEPDSPQAQLRREVAELKRLLGEQQETINQLKQRPAVLPETIEALGLDTPTGRRQAMMYGGAAALLPAMAAYALTGRAAADLVAADVGTQADPWRTGFFAALNAGDGQDAIDFETPFTLADNEISSATTIDAAQVVPYDCSVAGFTITLGTELAANGGWVVLIDETGSSGTNSMTVDTEAAETIDGGASITINHDAAITTIYWDGDEWRTTRFIDTVDARTIATEGLTFASSSFLDGKALADDGSVYDTIQAAENAATDWIWIGPGTFSEAVTVDTAGLSIWGSGRGTLISGGSSTALLIQADGVSVKGLACQTTAGGGNSVMGLQVAGNSAVQVHMVWIEESDDNGIYLNATSDSIVTMVWCDSANIDGDDVRLTGTTSGNVVDDVIGTVSDAGTGNAVGETA